MAGQTLADLFPPGVQDNFFATKPVSVFDLSQSNSGAGLPSLSSLQGQVTSSGPNFFKDVALNQESKTPLTSIFEQTFGADYRSQPDVQQILGHFNNQLTQKFGVSTLSKLVESGKRVTDYLAGNQSLLAGRSGQRIMS